MDPIHFLTLGFDLATKDQGSPTHQTPAYRRTAISRSYYGAHHTVVAALAKFEWFVSQASYGHDEAQEILKVAKDPVMLAASVHLADLYNRRHDADYRLELTHPETVGFAVSSWEIAMEVHRATEAMMEEPLRTKMATGLAAVFIGRWMIEHAGGKLPHWRPLKRDKKLQKAAVTT